MPTTTQKIDPPTCREDIVRKAAASNFRPDFDWVDEKQEKLAFERTSLMPYEIRELAREWILAGNKISCVPETGYLYRDRRHFHYDIVIQNVAGFPRGLYVEMEICNLDPNEPAVNLLSSHESRGR